MDGLDAEWVMGVGEFGHLKMEPRDLVFKEFLGLGVKERG